MNLTQETNFVILKFILNIEVLRNQTLEIYYLSLKLITHSLRQSVSSFYNSTLFLHNSLMLTMISFS